MAQKLDPADWGLKRQNQVSRGGLFFLFGIFAFLGGLFLAFFGYKLYWNVRALTVFEPAECEILGKRLVESDGDDGTTYGVELHFRYDAGGRLHERKGYDVLGGTSSGRRGKEAILDRYEVGQTATCWFDPEEPSYAVIDRSLSWIYLLAFIPLIFVVIGGSGLWAALRGDPDPTVTVLPTALNAASDVLRFANSGAERPLPPEAFGAGAGHFSASSAALGNLAGRTSGLAAEWLPKIPVLPGQVCPYRLTQDGSRLGAWIAILFVAAFWNGIVSVFVSEAISSWRDGSPEIFLSLFVIPFVLVGLFLIWAAVSNFLVWLGIGETRLELDSWPLTLGKTHGFRFAQQGRMFLEELKVDLVCQEKATYGQGTDSVTKTHELHRQTLLDLRGVSIDHWRAFESSGKFELPEAAMHSFKAGHNEIDWALEVNGSVARWPDFKTRFPLLVMPGEASGNRDGREPDVCAPPSGDVAEPLTVELESPGRGYGPGEPVQGTVRLSPLLPSEDGTLMVAMMWQTVGIGDEDSGVVAPQHVLARGLIEAGRAYPFELSAPAFPRSYSGKLVSIRWSVGAQLKSRRRKKLLGRCKVSGIGC
jgi:hypothetical protein